MTLCPMATITFRTDAEVDQAIAELGAAGDDRSQVIRDAVLFAWRTRQNDQLRAETAALVADEADVAEARAVLAEMERLRAG